VKEQHQTDPDPVRRLLWAAYDALAPALGAPDPASRARHLAELARLVAAAQAANDALLRPARRAD
jgi:hypothetical protein